MKILPVTLITLAIAATDSLACGNYESLKPPQALVLAATSDDAARAETAIQGLRALGRQGFEALLETHAGALANPDQLEPKVRRVLDVVAGQRDAHAARLFWHTDLERAKAEAQKLGRPILSLRLLGRLDEEFSCANSRYFRTALYPNREINDVLREDFVLHWESVRPAPRVTIDYGDGRKLERTITGNSAHYVLAADGRPIDALPGLFGPKPFLRELRAAVELNQQYLAAESASERKAVLRNYHSHELMFSLHSWMRDLRQVRATVGQPEQPSRVWLAAQTQPEDWKAIAVLHRTDARLDEASKALMRAKNAAPRAAEAGRIAVSKAALEDPMLRAMDEFERSMAEDSVRNHYHLHTQIHEWFAQDAPDIAQVNRMNNRVYAELFLMPSWDPWLGLRPPNAYSALENDGATLASTAPAK